MQQNSKQMYIGLMSGTSLDGIDAVLVEFNDSPRLVASYSTPLPISLRQRLFELTTSGNHEIERIAEAEPAFAKVCANATRALLDQCSIQPGQISAIGSHGQTIRHIPEKAYTLQIGDPSLIAELTGITVVADFRRRDIAAGGQGAPLVPAFHQSVFRSPSESRVIANVGGMANLTILDDQPVRGFDTGPGNVLMDLWCQRHKNQPYDKDGQWSSSVDHDRELLEALLDDTFFQTAPPKSTGRERFNAQWLEHKLAAFPELSPDTVQSTLCQLTAESIANDVTQYAHQTNAVYLCGGGAHNLSLIKRLEALLPNQTVTTTESLGLHPDWVEAIAFAWLARQSLHHQPGNLPDVTGAKGARILGAIYPA